MISTTTNSADNENMQFPSHSATDSVDESCGQSTERWFVDRLNRVRGLIGNKSLYSGIDI